jgi:hypothetical protein
MPRQALRPGSGQAKSPSLAQDILVLGDIYLALAWLAIKRLRHGPVWPWDVQPNGPAPVVTLVRPREEAEEATPAATPKRD